jgi:hypothetical protein
VPSTKAISARQVVHHDTVVTDAFDEALARADRSTR